MHKQTKALDIPQKVKDEVLERDGHQCIICGSIFSKPNAHYISRAHGGLGIPENVVTLCFACHDFYDNGAGGGSLRPIIAEYLRSQYPGWDERKLVYRKYDLPNM